MEGLLAVQILGVEGAGGCWRCVPSVHTPGFFCFLLAQVLDFGDGLFLQAMQGGGCLEATHVPGGVC
jgi:hypothetical protein